MRGRGNKIARFSRCEESLQFQTLFSGLKPGAKTQNSIDSIGRNHIVQEYVITLLRQPAGDLSQDNL